MNNLEIRLVKTKKELEQVNKIRTQVFVEEQNIPSDLEFDGLDLEDDANGPYHTLVDESLKFTGSSSGVHSPHSCYCTNDDFVQINYKHYKVILSGSLHMIVHSFVGFYTQNY